MVAALAIALTLAGQWMCPARFAPLPKGWVQGNLGPSMISTDSFAHTQGFFNLNDIRPGGVYVWMLLNPRQPTSPASTARKPLRLPLRLGHVDQIGSQEGPPLPEYRFAGRYHGYYVDVRVDFGRKHPTATMRRWADRLLARLRLPRRLVTSPSACRI
jgi:hypothetical protein